MNYNCISGFARSMLKSRAKQFILSREHNLDNPQELFGTIRQSVEIVNGCYWINLGPKPRGYSKSTRWFERWNPSTNNFDLWVINNQSNKS